MIAHARTSMRSSWVAGAALLLAGLTPQAMLADGQGTQPAPHVSTAPPAYTERSAADCSDAGTPAGQIVAVSGAVFAQAPGEPQRALACDDAVNACDRITTGDGGSVAMVVGGVWAGLESGADVTLESAGPSFYLHDGAMRVIDTRLSDEGAPFSVETPHLAASGIAADTELRVGLSGAQERTRLCSHGGPVTATTTEGTQSVGGGACVAAGAGALFADGTQRPSIGTRDSLACEPQLAGTGGLGDRFNPFFVGPGPLAAASFLALDRPDTFGRAACDDPGSGCVGPPIAGATGQWFKDQNPATGCGFPGAPCP